MTFLIDDTNLNLKCALDTKGTDYIYELYEFGFLYKLDYLNDGFSNGTHTCSLIGDPFYS